MSDPNVNPGNFVPSAGSALESGMARMKFIAFDDGNFERESGKSYQVLFNPDQLQENINIAFDKTQIPFTSGNEPKFNKILPQTFSLNLLFDATGVIPDPESGGYQTKPVMEQIRDFKDVCSKYEGEIHQPRFLKVVYGRFQAQGRVESIQITYTHFSPAGEPLRAKATVSFLESISFRDRQAKEANSSPDLTHARTTLDGDTLPLMTERIYGDPGLYQEVARYNGLNHFRKLKAGAQLIFPPLTKPNG